MRPFLRPPATSLLSAIVLTCALGMGVFGASAQSRFDAVVRVNDSIVTQFEIEQRVALLQALGAPGDLLEEARERLIDERLQLQAARDLSISVTDEGVEQGIAEFAARANVSADEFLAVLSRNGVARETFEDFVTAGLLWREVVRTRFAPRAQVTEADVDRAVALAGREGGARVLMSEVILPARTPQETAASEARARQISQINGFEAFAAAARNFSVAPTRERGGRIDWIPLNRLPPALRSQILTLPPGGVSNPVRVPNAIAVFQLRALQEVPADDPDVLAIEYAEFRIPGGDVGDARRVADEIDTCDDLYGVARNLPEDRLVRETRQVAEIPADLRAELARLDPDEVTTAINRGGVQLLVMLCGRTTEVGAELDRATIRRDLLNQRIESYATGYLAELRSDAVIVEVR